MLLLCHIPSFPSRYSPLSCPFSATFPGFQPIILHYHVPSLPHSQVFILIFSIIMFLPCQIPRFPSKYSLYHFFSSLPYSQSQYSIRVFNVRCFPYFFHKPHVRCHYLFLPREVLRVQELILPLEGKERKKCKITIA